MTTPTKTRSDFPHGTVERARGSNHAGIPRCHCHPCRKAERAYTKHRVYLQATGRSLLVDAEPVAQHLRSLMAQGDALTYLAQQIGHPRSALAYIIGGRSKRIRREIAEKVLALEAGRATASNLSVPSIGAVRRVRALMAVGHPLNAISAAAGMEHTAASYLLNNRTPTIHYELAQRVDKAYRALFNSRGDSVRSLRRAAREGWPPPAAWDDDAIDDPNRGPEIVEDLQLSRDELAEYRRQEIEFLDGYGCTPEEIAERLGMALSTVRTVVRELHTGQRRERTPRTEAAA